MKLDDWQELLTRYGCAALTFNGTKDAIFERRLALDHVIDPGEATPRERFEALAGALRDVLAQRWLKTSRVYDRANPKQVYYLSMEFLIGRSLINNLTNLQFALSAEDFEKAEGLKMSELVEQEPDAGLGNGGLGRLAACFMDSLATQEIPAMGYGLRYDYGIFRQEIVNGYQREQPDPWLISPDPWEVTRRKETVSVRVGSTFEVREGHLIVHQGKWSQYRNCRTGRGGKRVHVRSHNQSGAEQSRMVQSGLALRT